MKKLIKCLLFFVLIVGYVKVKADPPFTVGIDTDYTTVYPGDEINVSIGLDYAWDEGLKVYEKDKNTGEYHYLIGDNNYYLVRDIQLIFDKKIFSIDLSKMEIADDNFILRETDDFISDGRIVYQFSLYMKDIRDNEVDDDYLDGIINDVLLKNIILTVNKNAQPGAYHIEVAFSDESEYAKNTKSIDWSNIFISKYPITIIPSSSNSKSIGRVYFTTENNNAIHSENYEYIPTNNKNEYTALFTDIEYINISCNSRCKVSNLGQTAADRANKVNTFKITYNDNSTAKYKIINEYYDTSIDDSWINHRGPYIIVLFEDEPKNSDELLDDLESAVNKRFIEYHYEDQLHLWKFKYSNLNEADKKLLYKFTKNDSKSYIYVLYYGTKYFNVNSANENSIKALINKINNNDFTDYIEEDNNENNNNIVDVVDTASNQKNVINLLLDNIYYIVLIGVGLICIIVLVIVLLVSKRKIEKDIKK